MLIAPRMFRNMIAVRERLLARLMKDGVAFTRPPTSLGAVKIAVFSDTVGNLIQLHQPL